MTHLLKFFHTSYSFWGFLAFHCLSPFLVLPILSSGLFYEQSKKEMTGCVRNGFAKTISSFLWSDGVGEWLVLIWLCWLADKSPEPRGENTENQSLLENFDVFDFVLLKLHILVEKLQIKQNPDCYFSCCQLSCSLSSVLPFLTHID